LIGCGLNMHGGAPVEDATLAHRDAALWRETLSLRGREPPPRFNLVCEQRSGVPAFKSNTERRGNPNVAET
jgi:hypothetical protein